MSASTPADRSASVGVFDSGIGGLSVLRHIIDSLPAENLLYFADSGFAPYGDKPEAVIVARTLAIAEYLLKQDAKALVVACNTATAASIQAVRERYPGLPVVGVEPGLKPAAALTRSKIVGVLATERTLASHKFNALRQQIATATQVSFLTQACIGLADQVEKGELASEATAALLRKYVTPLVREGADTLVLGCTHYPFVQALIEQIALETAQTPVTIVDTGEAVARQLGRLLQQTGLQNMAEQPSRLRAYSTGNAALLSKSFETLLQMRPEVMAATV